MHVLFVCLHNAGRSQISQALFEQAVRGHHEARSAGTTPADRVHPEVLEVMAELGIDLSERKPQLLTRELVEWADVLVKMGCGDQCPFVPGKRYIDWELPDPAGRPIGEVRITRDEINERVEQLVGELDTATTTKEPPHGRHRADDEPARHDHRGDTPDRAVCDGDVLPDRGLRPDRR